MTGHTNGTAADHPAAIPAQKRKAAHRKGGAPAAGSETGPESGPEAGADPVSGRGDDRRSPLRRCLISGDVRPKDQLIRFVLGPDGEVYPDLDGKLPGRGLWLSARRDMLETASRKRAFSKAARRQTTVSPDLPQQVERLLRQRCLNLLGFARRAGLAIAGFDKVAGAAKGGQVALLLEASDGAEDGRRKIMGAAAQAARDGHRMPVVIDLFTGAEMAAVLGREHVVHVAVTHGKLDQRALITRLAAECERLAIYVGLKDLPPGAADVVLPGEDSETPRPEAEEAPGGVE